MARRASDRPTEAELEILQVLWSDGPSSVREVNEALNRDRPTGYTTTLKLMQIMLEKGLLRRDTSTRDLLDRVFEGSASQLVMQVLSAGQTTPEEIEQIRRLLREKGKGTS